MVSWWISAALAEDPIPAGYVVLVGDAYPDEVHALAAFANTFDSGVPRHEDYPLVVALAAYERVGFGLAVAAPLDRTAADRLARALTARGLHAEVVRSAGPSLEDLHVLAIDAVHVTGNGAPLYTYELCLGPADDEKCWATGTLDADQRLVLPFLTIPPGTEAALRVKAGRPWTCPVTALGVAQVDLPIWLKSPVNVSCFEDSAPHKRKPTR